MIPAYEAERTIGATLDSLAGQTLRDWEAIVVDDGSADGTAAVVAERMAHDPRLQLVQQANGGVSRARNAGIAHARGRWLAFLDADDWLEPDAYAAMLAVLDANARLDGVHCGWTRIAPDGRESREICPHDAEDMLPWHAHNCGFAIHAVLVRRELVERAGGFDPMLITCEDWDMWLRLSRLGTRWARLERQLAWYRIRERSASMAARQMLHDGLVVIDRAHAPDLRLRDVPAERRDGVDVALRSRSRLVHGVYSAGLLVGQGRDGVALLEPLAEDRCADLSPDAIAYALLEGIPLGAGTVPADWPSFSGELIDRVSDLLEELERISGAPSLARRVKQVLERLVEEEGGTVGLFGRLEHVPVDLERPLEDLQVAPEVERVMVQPAYASVALPAVELPTWEGRVPAVLVADAVAAEHAWRVLGAFLAARDDAPA
ncbi:MAG TPA: glycosyltransferase, partial [Conexibacter sp.]